MSKPLGVDRVSCIVYRVSWPHTPLIVTDRTLISKKKQTTFPHNSTATLCTKRTSNIEFLLLKTNQSILTLRYETLRDPHPTTTPTPTLSHFESKENRERSHQSTPSRERERERERASISFLGESSIDIYIYICIIVFVCQS